MNSIISISRRLLAVEFADADFHGEVTATTVLVTLDTGRLEVSRVTVSDEVDVELSVTIVHQTCLRLGSGT